MVDRLGLRIDDHALANGQRGTVSQALLVAPGAKLLVNVGDIPLALRPGREPAADVAATGHRGDVVELLQDVELGKSLKQPKCKCRASNATTGDRQTGQAHLHGVLPMRFKSAISWSAAFSSVTTAVAGGVLLSCSSSARSAGSCR